MTGVYAKFKVTKQGERIRDCFVLRYDRDPVARLALVHYADKTNNMDLKKDIRRLLAESRERFDEHQKRERLRRSSQ